MRNNFAAFILTHGRPNKVITYKSLLKAGYTGKIYIIIDNEDKTVGEYKKIFGDKVIIFDKKQISDKIDEGDNFEDRRAIIYARNACFDIAKKLKIKYFIQLDDDYTIFAYTHNKSNDFKQTPIKNIDNIFDLFVDYFKETTVQSIAFIQSGDLIGGGENTFLKNNHYPFIKRKAMNTFICSTDKKFSFVGRINEDVNTYVRYGSTGILFLTIPDCRIIQLPTQSNKGGMTELYLDSGTYIKSFYTIMYHPSSVKIKLMGESHKRLHHSIKWINTVPKILDESYKK